MSKSIYSEKSRILTRWLCQQRKAAGLTQRTFASKLGVHHSIVGKIEQGERRIDVVEFFEYCRVLDANPHALIEELKKS